MSSPQPPTAPDLPPADPGLFHVLSLGAGPHGVWAAVRLPGTNAPVPEAYLQRLPPQEAAHARTLGGYRQPEFVGGRLALHRALREIGGPQDPVLPDARGTPQLAPGWTGSVSHKRHLALAMVARDTEGTLGIDLEQPAPQRLAIADRVLRPEELSAIADLPEAERWIEIVKRFSVKEAIYKALDPYVRRYVGFHEASVTTTVDGPAHVRLHLTQGEGPYKVVARNQWLHGHLLSTVRIRTGRGEARTPATRP